MAGYVEVVRLLLENGASANAQDRDCCTPSSHAMECGHTELVELLLPFSDDLTLETYCTTLGMTQYGVHCLIVEPIPMPAIMALVITVHWLTRPRGATTLLSGELLRSAKPGEEEVRREQCDSALYCVAEEDKVSTVRILLEGGIFPMQRGV